MVAFPWDFLPGDVQYAKSVWFISSRTRPGLTGRSSVDKHRKPAMAGEESRTELLCMCRAACCPQSSNRAGQWGPPCPCAYEELNWLPLSLPIPPCNEKKTRAIRLNVGIVHISEHSLYFASDGTAVRAPPCTLEGHFWEHFFPSRSLCRGAEQVPC